MSSDVVPCAAASLQLTCHAYIAQDSSHVEAISTNQPLILFIIRSLVHAGSVHPSSACCSAYIDRSNGVIRKHGLVQLYCFVH